MINLYPDRIEELHAYLERAYGQRDRQATEILLASLLPASLTSRAQPWIVIETDYLSRDCASAWFSFGGLASVRHLATARGERPRRQDEILSAWMAGTDNVYCDSEWRRLRPRSSGYNGSIDLHLSREGSYYGFLARTIALRAVYPKTDISYAQPDELRRLTGRVLDIGARASHASVLALGKPAQPANASIRDLLYWCELSQILSRDKRDWDTFICGINAIAHNVALLWADGRAPDWAAAERILRDSIPYEVFELLQSAGYMTMPQMQNKTMWREVKRLAQVRAIGRHRLDVGKTVLPRYKVTDDRVRLLVDRSKRILL